MTPLRALPPFEPRAIEGRQPPHDLGAEAAVLSALMIDPKAFDRIPYMAPEHFFSEAHRQIFKAAHSVRARAEPVDLATVLAELSRTERIAQVGKGYLHEVHDSAPYVANVDAYARIVFTLARVRRLIATCQRVAAEGYFDHGEHEMFIAEAARALETIAREGIAEKVEKNLDALKRLVLEIAAIAQKREKNKSAGGVTGIPTGIRWLDRITRGLHGKQLTIVAARPGVGKTSLGMQILLHAAFLGIGGAMFELEMTRDELLMRAVSQIARVDSDRLRGGDIGYEEWRRVQDAATKISVLPLQIDDTATLHVRTLRSRALQMIDESAREKQPLGIIVVDYLQFIASTPELVKAQRREQIGEAARELKVLAKETGVPVVALAQLNREVDKRTGSVRWPKMSDIADCGDIEKHADNILFIHREAKIEGENDREVFVDDGKAVFILAKQRGGKRGVGHVHFEGEHSRFIDQEGP